MSAKRTDANQYPDTLAAQCALVGLNRPQREHIFHPTRRWRFDLSWPELHVAVEVDGGVWSQGRHTRGSGWIKDAEKLNEAAILGWRVLHVTPAQVNSGEALNLVERIVKEAA
jgi:very-short-patch-repair endonuclease